MSYGPVARPFTVVEAFMGLPTIILPGYFASASPYAGLAQALGDRGHATTVVPLRRRDWIPTLGGLPMTPILNRLADTVKQVLADSGSTQVNLVGHSAGGWISRLYLGDEPYGGQHWGQRSAVAKLITLGTPHVSQERWTRANIDFVNLHYPGAFFQAELDYVCVAGKAVFGQPRLGTRIAYNSYSLTCGEGKTWGDGITPIQAAHLSGAKNVVLEGVHHSPRAGQQWYGSPAVIDQWIR